MAQQASIHGGGFEVGMIVRHEAAPEWGPGQVQSVDGTRVTVNFVEVGKRTLDIGAVSLRIEATGPGPRSGNED